MNSYPVAGSTHIKCDSLLLFILFELLAPISIFVLSIDRIRIICLNVKFSYLFLFLLLLHVWSRWLGYGENS